MERKIKRKNIIIIIVVAILLIGSAIGFFIYNEATQNKKEINKTDMVVETQLAVYQCSYHGVIKLNDNNTVIPVIWSQNKKMWFEFQANVSVGIDVDEMKTEINGDEITVYMPDAKVLDKPVIDSNAFTKETIITDKSGFLVSDIDHDDQIKAIKKAQTQVLEETKGNKALLNSAKTNAQDLIKKYVKNFNRQAGTNYIVTFISIE